MTETSAVAGPPRTAPAVRLAGIAKRFPGVVANHDVSLEVRTGTVHAIVGENGAGKSGLGLFDAAVQAGEGKWAIGVDSDQYLTASENQKPHILTSMIKRVDVGVFDYTQAVADGNPPSGYVVYDLESGGVGYSTSGGFIDDIVDQIEDYKQRIIDGEIKVPTEP